MHRTRNVGGAVFALLGLLATLSCADDTVGPGEPVPTSLVVVSGAAQTGVVGAELAQPLVVEVRDAGNNPLPGALVNFVVVRGNGSVFAGAAETDNNGRAQDYWRLGTSTADSQRVEVRSVSSTGAKQVHAVFTATATPGAVASVNVALDSTRLNFIGDTASMPAMAFDGYGNPVPAAAIRWVVLGTAGVVAIDSMTGRITAQTLGTRRIRARVGLVGDTARVTVAPVPANIDPLKDTVVANFITAELLPRMAAFDSGGARITAIVPLVWRSLDTAIVTMTDSLSGTARSRAPGIARLEARAIATGALDTVIASVRQVPMTLDVTPPTGVLGLGDSLQLSALAFDSAGYPVLSPPTFGWTSLDTTRVRVDATGRVYGRAYGSANVRAFVPSTSVGDLANITVRNADTLAIAVLGGSSQAGIVGQTLNGPLRVRVRNQFNEPQRDVPVVWWSPDGPVIATPATATDSLGESAVTVVLDTVAGIKRLYATIGHDTASFSVVSRPDVPASFLRLSLAAQSDTVGDTVPAPPRVVVRDRYGNGVPDVTVRFFPRSGSASTGNIALTDGDGRAVVATWRMDTIPGIDSIFAVVQDTLDSGFPRLWFTSVVVPDSASIQRSLLAIADTVRERDSTVVTVQLRDRYGNLLTKSDGLITFQGGFGLFQNVQDLGDGTYRAVMYPLGNMGTNWVFARLDGDSIHSGKNITSRSHRLVWLGTDGGTSYRGTTQWGAPGGPPSVNDTLHLVANGAASPVMTQNETINSVLFDLGAPSLNNASFDLTVTRDFIAPVGVGLSGTGRLIMTGLSVSLSGDSRSLRITESGRVSLVNNYTASGGRIVVQGGRLRSHGFRIRVRPQ